MDVLKFGFAMNNELDEVIVQDVSDDALELAAGTAQAGLGSFIRRGYTFGCWCSREISADNKSASD
jgi:hypothetical protein